VQAFLLWTSYSNTQREAESQHEPLLGLSQYDRLQMLGSSWSITTSQKTRVMATPPFAWSGRRSWAPDNVSGRFG